MIIKVKVTLGNHESEVEARISEVSTTLQVILALTQGLAEAATYISREKQLLNEIPNRSNL